MAKEFNFQYVIDTINENYEFTPTSFCVFPGTPTNTQGNNEGACRVLAFAKDQRIHHEKETVLELFAEHYDAVLADPDGDGHQNIRTVIKYGADSVHFWKLPLTRKKEYNAARVLELIEATRERARQRLRQ